MPLTRRARWLIHQPLWWIVQLQSLAAFLLAAGVGGPDTAVHRIALGVMAGASNLISTLALFADAPRTPWEEMTDDQRAKLLAVHPEAKRAHAVPPPLPPAEGG